MHSANIQSETSPPASSQKGEPLVSVRGLKVYFPIRSGFFRKITNQIRAVDDVEFSIPQGKTVGLVGESGSGKTTIGRSIIRLQKPTEGRIFYGGKEISTMPERDYFPYRKKIQMVFQDPFNSLNPRMTIQKTLEEPLKIHFKNQGRSERFDRIAELLRLVGLPVDSGRRFPHEFSGGQRQRIGIARALAVEPEFLILDEPVSALDVSVQAQIVNLLMDLQESLGLTYLFIAHDLAVVEQISDEVVILNRGKIMEKGAAHEVYSNPRHEYTRKLLAAVPKL